MNKSLCLLLFIFCGTFVDNTMTMQSQNKSHQQECLRCKKQSDTNGFVAFCEKCNIYICGKCDMQLAFDEPMFLEKSSDYFFIKPDCFNCNETVYLVGAPYISEMRHYLLMDRCKDNEHYEKVKQIPIQQRYSDFYLPKKNAKMSGNITSASSFDNDPVKSTSLDKSDLKVNNTQPTITPKTSTDTTTQKTTQSFQANQRPNIVQFLQNNPGKTFIGGLCLVGICYWAYGKWLEQNAEQESEEEVDTQESNA